MIPAPDNSYDSLLNKLREIYESQKETSDIVADKTNDVTPPTLEPHTFKSSNQIDDTGNIAIKPQINQTITCATIGELMPTIVNYTYTHTFKLPAQYLGFLGFENSWNVVAPSELSSNYVYKADVWTPPVYQIIGDGQTLWLGAHPPKHYLSKLTHKQAQQALYYNPSWTFTIPTNVGGAPAKGTYDATGFIAVTNMRQLHPNTTGSYFAYDRFIAMNVTNISGGNWTGVGMLCSLNGQTSLQGLQNQISGGGGPAAFQTLGIWPRDWIDPNDLSTTHHGITPAPGQYVEYGGGAFDGRAIYQAGLGQPQFITPGTLFLGITFEARFPRAADFVAAGCDPTDAAVADAQLFEGTWWNDLGGGTITNTFNNPGSPFENVRVPGDLGLFAISAASQIIIFNVMWQHYKAGTNASWLFVGFASGFSPNVFPAATITYNVTQTHPLSEIVAIFYASGQPGTEVMYPATDPNANGLVSPFLSTLCPSSSNWTYAAYGFRAFYDPGFSTPLFILGTDTNPNLGRPDQHQSLDPLFRLAGGIGDIFHQPYNAVAWYYFPYINVQLIVNPDPYPKNIPVYTAGLTNTYDPFFIKQSKSTSKEELWQCQFPYSAVLLSPAVLKDQPAYLKWSDTTIFGAVSRSDGYIVNASEGLGPFDVGGPVHDFTYNDGNPNVTVTSGPPLYGTSTPNTTVHNTTSVKRYQPAPDDIQTRVKVQLRPPLDWHKINKWNVEER